MNMRLNMPLRPLQQLLQQDDFIGRHIGPNPQEQQQMLKQLGYDSMNALIEATVPGVIRRNDEMQLGEACTEVDALAELKTIASKNQVFKNYIGMGYYDTHTPHVILRNVLENPGWYTAYTPYQPEISQGRLEALLNFQQMVMDLTGMDLANASLLDEGTAAAEAMTLSHRVNKKNKSNNFFIADDCHPQTIAVVTTRAEGYGFDVIVAPAEELNQHDVFGALLQYPGTYGHIKDIAPLIEAAHTKNTLVTLATDLLSLTLLKTPGELGADIVVGNSQRFGVPMGFGGPHAAFFATRDAYKRSIPGRVIGVSIDSHGKPALRMAMQTREQHIRREKATSNICTAQALLAIMASFYAVYHGPQGLKTIGERVYRLTTIFAEGCKQLGFTPDNSTWFDTLTFTVEQQESILSRAQAAELNLRVVDEARIGISFDETTTLEDIQTLWEVLSGETVNVDANSINSDLNDNAQGLQASQLRQTAFLQHPVFNSHHSETAMLRYMRQLESKDISLNRSMIALGSCTMKLNATAEMIPITWPEFAKLHPFAPIDQATGYVELFKQLEHQLKECTGYDAFSLQPNAGSQGEYAGLLAIKRYHENNGDTQRNICLIPSSAHGTNPASAAMLNMKIVIVKCDDNGNVDLEDLSSKAEQHSNELAALMVTYPSTHGVFETHIREVCATVHKHGGQVYVDGANLNALVGIAAPGEFGADVSHLNLHKTFCIPHGGGGPGMGPIGVRAHLAEFLPNHPVQTISELSDTNDTVSAATWGSAAILPISWMYIRMMGAEGLRSATEHAILNAKYMAKQLSEHFPVLYTGQNGLVAHECIIDLRPLKEESGISEEDVAKRLMDFGFHAPTMSFPVAGTLMIEPTESESKEEMDRFITAMAQIKTEINKVIDKTWDAENNALKNAPHTAASLLSNDWNRSYSREEAAYPADFVKQDKYWPPVGRLDNVYGDRNLICSCPSIESYE